MVKKYNSNTNSPLYQTRSAVGTQQVMTAVIKVTMYDGGNVASGMFQIFQDVRPVTLKDLVDLEPFLYR